MVGVGCGSWEGQRAWPGRAGWDAEFWSLPRVCEPFALEWGYGTGSLSLPPTLCVLGPFQSLLPFLARFVLSFYSLEKLKVCGGLW